ncbi:MAG: SusC/RagA family TonB-linked outer membrane protein, partial [Bacteroidales bacterium]
MNDIKTLKQWALFFIAGLLLTMRVSGSLPVEKYDYKTFTSNIIQQQQKTVAGKVTDQEGLGMPGVNVLEKGTSNGTVTDMDGKFSIVLKAENPILVFSFLGYLSQEINVGDKTDINVQLQQDIKLLNEVMVVGYGVQKKATLSGSVSSVKGEEIVKVPAMNVTGILGGKIAGLVAVGQSGEPGADYSTLFIRGRSTLNDNSPLIVVDGIPNRSLERIDPSTIESITILKDASGAIYGSQAANGVILVNTKRGSSEKLTITASYSSGFSQPTKISEMTNSAEYCRLVNEVMYYREKNPTYSEEDIQKYGDGSDPWRYPNTDWFNEVLKPWSFQDIANVTISGGNERIRSFVSVSSRNQ